jgi:hypothetical protein
MKKQVPHDKYFLKSISTIASSPIWANSLSLLRQPSVRKPRRSCSRNGIRLRPLRDNSLPREWNSTPPIGRALSAQQKIPA